MTRCGRRRRERRVPGTPESRAPRRGLGRRDGSRTGTAAPGRPVTVAAVPALGACAGVPGSAPGEVLEVSREDDPMTETSRTELDSRAELMASQDDCLLAIEDGNPVPAAKLGKLP